MSKLKKKSAVFLTVLLLSVCAAVTVTVFAEPVEVSTGTDASAETGSVKIETVETDEFTMDYFHFGQGKDPLVILPGLSVQSVMGSAEAVAEAYQPLAEDFTIYVFDRRKELPEGYSIYEMAQDTAEAIQLAGLEEADLFGVSQGGMIAMEIAVHHPELVKKMVLGSTSSCETEKLKQLTQEWIKLAEDRDADRLYHSFGEALYPEEVYEQSEEVLSEAAKTVTDGELDHFIILAKSMEGFDITDELSQITCPVLLIGSEDDRVLGAEATDQIAAQLNSLPGFALYMYDGYGHAAYDTAPDYKERILAYLVESQSGVGQAADISRESDTESRIENWCPDAPSMQSIVEFVMESMDENADGFIPEEDRIAVFDMDGTLFGERFPTYFNDWLFIQRALYDENYDAPEKLKTFAQAWEDKVLKGIPIEDFDAKERELGPQLYEGLTPDEYADVVRRFKEMPVWGFDGMTYGEAFFQPMVSLVKYLYDNDYTIYIVSATYRDAVRVMIEDTLDEYIPWDHVIGTDLLYVASGDAAEDSMFYELTPEDELVLAGRLFQKDQKTNKAVIIQREIGKVPVLAFGNSTGDFSMATYTLQNGKYHSRAYMLLCDDTQRDYGDPEAAAGFKGKCDANGFYTVSMQDEFETLYGDGVEMIDMTQEVLEPAA